MFTGIIQGLGTVCEIKAYDQGSSWTINLSVSNINLGASISVNGVCSTIKSYDENTVNVDYLPETLKKTTFTQIKVGDQVNIENSLKYGDEIGGHLITGHIDTVGIINKIEKQGDFYCLEIGYSSKFAPYVISKGSIAVDGISLTVVMDDDTVTDYFEVHIIPHTWQSTNLQNLSSGDRVNLEFDQLGKYEIRRKQVLG